MLDKENMSEEEGYIIHQPETNTDPNPYGEASLLCATFMVCVGAIGLLSNATTIRIFTRGQIISSINALLAGLALVDAALLITAVPLYSSVALYSYLTRYYSYADDQWYVGKLEAAIAYMTVYVYPFTSVFQTASVWVMVLITIERYIAVCYPFVARKTCTRPRAILALVVVLVLSVLYNISRFWEYEIRATNQTDLGAETATVEVVKALRSNTDYMNIFVHWFYFIFLFALPFGVLVLFNSMVVATIRRANHFRSQLTRRQCKEHATATMMVVVAVVFLACNSLGCVLNVMDVFGFSTQQNTTVVEWNAEEARLIDISHHKNNNSAIREITGSPAAPDSSSMHMELFYFMIDLSNLLVMVHCSCNFFIYLIFSNRFRTYFCTMSPCCFFVDHRRSSNDLKWPPTSMDGDPTGAFSPGNHRRQNGHSVCSAGRELLPQRSTTFSVPRVTTSLKQEYNSGQQQEKNNQSPRPQWKNGGDVIEPLIYARSKAQKKRFSIY